MHHSHLLRQSGTDHYFKTRIEPRRALPARQCKFESRTPLLHDAGNHRGGCGDFAVRSCNGDAMTKTRINSASISARRITRMRFMSCDNFRVIGFHRAGNNDHAGITYVFRAMDLRINRQLPDSLTAA